MTSHRKILSDISSKSAVTLIEKNKTKQKKTKKRLELPPTFPPTHFLKTKISHCNPNKFLKTTKPNITRYSICAYHSFSKLFFCVLSFFVLQCHFIAQSSFQCSTILALPVFIHISVLHPLDFISLSHFPLFRCVLASR